MKALATQTHYSLRQVQALSGLSRAVVTRLVASDFVTPVRDARGEMMFSLQDLMLLRTALDLQQARIPPRKILSSLRQLKARLPSQLPMTGLTITAVGAEVVVRDRGADWSAESGQLLMDFEGKTACGSVSVLSAKSAPVAEPFLLATVQAMERSHPRKAECAYRRALDFERTNQPDTGADQVDVYLSFGAFLCNLGRHDEAVMLYAQALSICPECADLWFNQSIAFEDLGQLQQAAAGYRQCLTLAPEFADAHYNLGLLLERLGDGKAALRHLNAYRQLEQ